MSTKEILRSIKLLPFNQRLYVIERALKTLHDTTDSQLANAADALLIEYTTNEELTAFTALDFETFYEAR
jgi:hypothetical protein